MRDSWKTLAAASLAWATVASADAADLIVSAQDGKFVRVEGRATFPESPPADSLVVLDASRFPPVVKTTVDSGLEHTVQGPPQAVAITRRRHRSFASTSARTPTGSASTAPATCSSRQRTTAPSRC